MSHTLVKTLCLDGIEYAMPLDAVESRVVDAAGRSFLAADGPQQARVVARAVNMAAGYVLFAPVAEAAQ